MCGISAIFGPNISAEHKLQIQAMNKSLAHRGPDNDGVYTDSHCAMGHRRLSIIDLSPEGNQPFTSNDGRYIMIYNGEIFNYKELRQDLQAAGIRFYTKTDTEVLLKMFVHYGSGCLNKLNGMFVFIVYDSKEKTAFIARDRFGIKPLYYGVHAGYYYFASEIKALTALDLFPFAVNELAVLDFFAFNRTDIADTTFFQHIHRFSKASYGLLSQGCLNLYSWWSPFEFTGKASPAMNGHILENIRSLFVSATSLRMRSDVPVGSCLSGGLDSSIIMGILTQSLAVQADYKTFTASFPNHAIDETSFIDDLQQKYQFANYRTYPNAQQAYDSFNDFSYFQDEPTAGASVFAQYQVMKLAREHGVVVLLDGQGGDENFAGYQYFHGFHFWELLLRGKLISLFAEIIKSLVRKQHILAYQTFFFQLLPGFLRKKAIRANAPFLSKAFFNDQIDKSIVYNRFFDVKSVNDSLAHHFMYKLEHLLRYEDRNSMAFAIEARVPYLDYRLVEYLLTLPGNLKLQHGENKLLQKKALGQYTTDSILKRKDKIGFGTPTDEWMRETFWQEASIENCHYLRRQLPHIFPRLNLDPSVANNKHKHINANNLWKLNQLACWLKRHK